MINNDIEKRLNFRGPIQLYTDNGLYLNFPDILATPYKRIMIISMRGGGKTYGALQELKKRGERFVYFRRTDKALAMALDRDYHIYNELNINNGWDVRPKINSKTGVGRFEEDGEPIAYCFNLSTFSRIRSIGTAKALGVKWLVFDEFLPEQKEPHRYDTFTAWNHADETLTRNAELEGYEVRRLMMANADTIRGDMLAGFDVADEFMMMQETGIEIYEHSPDFLLLRPHCDALMKLKSGTSLYQETAGSGFSDVALSNTFMIEDRQMIGSRNLSEYRPVAAISHICIYRHKSRKGEYYISDAIAGKPRKVYGPGESERTRFIRENTPVYLAYMRNKVYYSSVKCQTRFLQVYDEI